MIGNIRLMGLRLAISSRAFAGKTEMTGKFKTPVIKMRFTARVYPPPGDDLKLPKWTPEFFMTQIGGDCGEYADKFKSLDEIFGFTSVHFVQSCRKSCRGRVFLVSRGSICCVIWGEMVGVRNLLRRGLIDFDYIKRRTATYKVRDN
eukprot:TRINITY_DN20819_c0_g1_i1.p1 TRINITY_DN20819_c0_g1~~TRINITY_DN20819_c0_g1_i1.p1  ORF type:complete len:147 (+),score=5.83 TRINITY_DN20819_c0_g1_i1:117-557(+)